MLLISCLAVYSLRIMLAVMVIAAVLPITPFHSGPINDADKGSYLASFEK